MSWRIGSKINIGAPDFLKRFGSRRNHPWERLDWIKLAKIRFWQNLSDGVSERLIVYATGKASSKSCSQLLKRHELKPSFS
jgi:hypothetical protein